MTYDTLCIARFESLFCIYFCSLSNPIESYIFKTWIIKDVNI